MDHLFFSNQAIEDNFKLYFQKKRGDLKQLFENENNELNFMEFANNFSKLSKLAFAAIKDKSFQLQPAKCFKILADKHRTIHKFSHLDTFILFHLACCIEKTTKHDLPKSLYSYQKGKSSKQALRVISSLIKGYNEQCYVIRRDINAFGESMQHSFILEDLKSYCSASDQILNLVNLALEFETVDKGSHLVKNKTGLPNGHFIQLVIENLYLINLDRALEQTKPGIYCRYGDDIIFVTNNKTCAAKAAQIIDEHLISRGLTLNNSKCSNLCLLKPHEIKRAATENFNNQSQFKYLGSIINYKGEILQAQKKYVGIKSIINQTLKVTSCASRHIGNSEAKCKLLIDSINQALLTNQNNLLDDLKTLVRNDRQLFELDRWIALTLLKYALSRGFNKGNFKIVSYHKLRSLGLLSLRHYLKRSKRSTACAI